MPCGAPERNLVRAAVILLTSSSRTVASAST
ncbi:Uncharacterised protein [Mycobacterium tuberculosis]|nr:Uncharacterised protein [Mycobacterium tuberculosis]